MLSIETGSYVTHAKLPELGPGEVLGMDKGAVRIRFASGERSFSMDFAAQHLSVTTEAPAKAAPQKGRARSKKVKAS